MHDPDVLLSKDPREPPERDRSGATSHAEVKRLHAGTFRFPRKGAAAAQRHYERFERPGIESANCLEKHALRATCSEACYHVTYSRTFRAASSILPDHQVVSAVLAEAPRRLGIDGVLMSRVAAKAMASMYQNIPATLSYIR